MLYTHFARTGLQPLLVRATSIFAPVQRLQRPDLPLPRRQRTTFGPLGGLVGLVAKRFQTLPLMPGRAVSRCLSLDEVPA
jgi:hypothetical protein